MSAVTPPYVFDAVPVNAVHAVSSTVRHQWGETGYRMTLEPRHTFQQASHWDGREQTTFYVFGVRASDGSEFYLAADRWENVYEATWTGAAFALGDRV